MPTIIQGCNHYVGHWSTSLAVAGRNGAVVCGGWCKTPQCEGTCLCIVHRDRAFPTTVRNAGQGVASDYPITQGWERRGPREGHILRTSTGNDYETLGRTIGSWEREMEVKKTHVQETVMNCTCFLCSAISINKV